MNCPAPTAREILEAAHAEHSAQRERPHWFASDSGEVIGHTQSSVNCGKPSQRAAVTAMRQGGAL